MPLKDTKLWQSLALCSFIISLCDVTLNLMFLFEKNECFVYWISAFITRFHQTFVLIKNDYFFSLFRCPYLHKRVVDFQYLWSQNESQDNIQLPLTFIVPNLTLQSIYKFYCYVCHDLLSMCLYLGCPKI